MHLELTNVSKVYHTRQGPIQALENINIHVEIGELVSIVGASGAGKSTLLRLVAGLELPTSGSITVDGDTITGPGPDRGMVFQNYTLYPWMTVAKNVEFGLKLQGWSKAERLKRTADYLDIVDLASFAQAYPSELSGGMKQRVAIARALVCEPKILLMDEPFGALDVQTKETMQQFLYEVWQRTQASIMIITHDVAEAIFLSQRVYVLTRRPGTVYQEFSMELPADRTYELKQEEKFQTYYEAINKLIRKTLVL